MAKKGLWSDLEAFLIYTLADGVENGSCGLCVASWGLFLFPGGNGKGVRPFFWVGCRRTFAYMLKTA